MSMIPLTIESLTAHLERLAYDVKFQEATNQLYIIFKEEEREYPLFIKVEHEGKMLQLIIFLPCQVQTKSPGDLARMLHFLNKEIDFPGFGMDENINVVFYRVMLPTSDGMLNGKVFEQMMAAIPKLANLFYQPIASVANGMSFDLAVEKVKFALQRLGA